jgi:hypothetical protein
MTEGEIQKQIIDYCTLKGALVFRMNSGSRNYNNKQAPKGTPDLFVVLNQKGLWVEVKTLTGKVSEAQLNMHDRLIKLGQRVIIARCLDDVIKEIK